MELRLAEIAEYCVGHVTVSPDAVALRCTPQQIDYFKDAPPQQARSRMSAGVQIALRTDSPWIELELRFAGHARPRVSLDLDVNGVLLETIAFEDTPNAGTARWALGETAEERELRVHLPHTAICQLRAVRLADGATQAPGAIRPRRMLALGDSITQGMNASGPARGWASLFAKRCDAECLNQGIGGHIWDPRSLDTEIAWEPELITVAFGTNDWSKPVFPRDLRPRITQYLEGVKRRWPTVPIAVISPLNRVGAEVPEEQPPLKTYGSFIRSVAGESPGIIPIDGFELMPDEADMLDDDGTHPGDAGMAAISQRLHRRISPLLSPHRCS